MKRSLTSIPAAALCAMAALAAPDYENDFSTRRSGGVPVDGWYEMPYYVGSLAMDYRGRSANPYNDVDTQDGWVKAYSTLYGAKFHCATNSSGTGTLPGDANQFGRFTDNSGAKLSTTVIHPINNEFHTGVVRIRFDIRSASSWDSGAYLRFAPVFKSKLKASSWESGGKTPVQFVVQNQGGTDGAFLLSGDGNGGVTGFDGSAIRKGHWVRFEMYLDLDANTTWGEVQDLGTDHPAMDANGESWLTFARKHFVNNLTEATGPLAGICLMASKVDSGNPMDVSNALCCDNISVAWKAPGGTDYETCYENDFSVRRYRTLSPAPTTIGNYVVDNVQTSGTFTAYNVGSSPTASVSGVLRGNVTGVQPIGLDGWRRINQNGGTGAAVVTCPGDGGNVLRFSGSEGAFGIAAQTLGERITSGKVRFSVDFRTPDKWYQGSYIEGLVVGDEAYYTTAAGSWLCRCEISGTSATTFYPFSNNGTTSTRDTSVVCSPTNWYRAVVTLDVDARKYDCALYNIGKVDSVAAGWTPGAAPIYSRTGQAFYKDVSEVASFGLRAYGAGTTASAKSHMYFDNIRVWKNVGTTQEKLIYDNDFTRRIRFFDAGIPSAPLVAADSFNVDDGFDHWIRRQWGTGAMSVVGVGNQCVKADCPQSYSYLLQSLGCRYRRGIVNASVDIRPPQFWTWAVGGAYVFFGDDIFLQGNGTNKGSAEFGKHALMGVGFAPNSTTTDGGIVSDVRLYYANGNGNGTSTGVKLTSVTVDRTHWYRFATTADVEANCWSLKVYDMGASQPTLATANGTLVAQVANLGFRNVPVGGISSVEFATFGVSASLEGLGTADPGPVFYDNVKVWKTPTAMTITVR